MPWSRSGPDLAPEPLGVADDPGVLDQAVRQAEEGGAGILDLGAGRLDVAQGAAMGAGSGHSRHHSIADCEDLVGDV